MIKHKKIRIDNTEGFEQAIRIARAQHLPQKSDIVKRRKDVLVKVKRIGRNY